MLYFIEDKNLIVQQIITYKHLFYDSISISEIDFTHGIRPLTIKRQPHKMVKHTETTRQ